MANKIKLNVEGEDARDYSIEEAEAIFRLQAANPGLNAFSLSDHSSYEFIDGTLRRRGTTATAKSTESPSDKRGTAVPE